MGHFLRQHWYGLEGAAATPVLSLVNNGDGTATATVTGADSAATVTVYYQRFDTSYGAGTWTSGGSRTGNGTVTLTLAAGHYLIYAKAVYTDSGAASLVHYLGITDGTTSVQYRVLDAVQTRLRALGLTGIASGSIIVKKLPLLRALTDNALALPGVIISPTREQRPTTGTNDRDDVVYPVQVAIFSKDQQEKTLAVDLTTHTLWRQQISRAFHNQRLAGVDEVVIASVEPQEVFSLSAWLQQHLVGGLLIRFRCREPRGS